MDPNNANASQQHYTHSQWNEWASKDYKSFLHLDRSLSFRFCFYYEPLFCFANLQKWAIYFRALMMKKMFPWESIKRGLQTPNRESAVSPSSELCTESRDQHHDIGDGRSIPLIPLTFPDLENQGGPAGTPQLPRVTLRPRHQPITDEFAWNNWAQRPLVRERRQFDADTECSPNQVNFAQEFQLLEYNDILSSPLLPSDTMFNETGYCDEKSAASLTVPSLHLKIRCSPARFTSTCPFCKRSMWVACFSRFVEFILNL